jgi:Flp pilus assembly protein TadG
MKRHEKNSNHAMMPGHVRNGRSAVAMGRPCTRGQALVELMAIIPMIFLLIVLAMNFGGLINAWIAVANATRAAADYAILSGSSAGLPTQATSTTLQNLINADLSALPNLSASNPHACVRQNNNGTYTTIMEMPSGACANYSDPPTDGEDIASGNTTNYINYAVDITYTYTSFFTSARLFGYPLVSLPTSVHQRAVMRLQ